MRHIMKYRVLTVTMFMALVMALITGLPSGTAQAANCGGLPVSGGIIPAGTYTMTDNCTVSATLEIAGGSEVTINGNGFTISGSNSMRVLLAQTGAMLNLNGVTVADGAPAAVSMGGGVLNNGSLVVTDSTFSNNVATIGGGLFSNGMLEVRNSDFSTNTASSGGAIYISESATGTIIVSNSTFSGNIATTGGGISSRGTLSVTGSTFANNSASTGGGINNDGGTVTVSNSTFSDNSTDSGGGGIYSFWGTVKINNSTFSGNRASYGGGIYIYVGSTLEVSNSTFSNNSAVTEGGGINTYGTPLTVSNSIFSGNSADFGSGISHIGTITVSTGPGTDALEHYMGAITCSQIVNNNSSSGTDIQLSGSSLTADNNWWGAETGPNTPGADTTNVVVSSWLSEPDPACAAVVGSLAPAPPMLNDITDGEIVAYDVPDGFYGRVLMQDGAWQTNPGTIPQELIENGVILAVDIFQLSGQQENNEFGAHVPVCLLGSGRLIFLDATTSPRTMVELETFTQDGMTCGWIPNAGTLVLIEGE